MIKNRLFLVSVASVPLVFLGYFLTRNSGEDPSERGAATPRMARETEKQPSVSGVWRKEIHPVLSEEQSDQDPASREEALKAMKRGRRSDWVRGGMPTDTALLQITQPDFENFASIAHIKSYASVISDPATTPDERRRIIDAVQKLDRRDYMDQLAGSILEDGNQEAASSLAAALASDNGWTSTSTYLEVAREHFSQRDEGDTQSKQAWDAFLDAYLKNLPEQNLYGVTDETSRISALSSYFREDPSREVAGLAAETLVYLDSPNAISEVVQLLQTTYANRSDKHEILIETVFDLAGPKLRTIASQLQNEGRLHASVKTAFDLAQAKGEGTVAASSMDPKFIADMRGKATGCTPCETRLE